MRRPSAHYGLILLLLVCVTAEESCPSSEWIDHHHENASCLLEGVRLECSDGVEEDWFREVNFSIRELMFISWPNGSLFPPETIMCHFPAVEVLSIQNSSLRGFSEDFPASETLKVINLNRLPNITFEITLLSNLEALEKLDLRSNRIDVIHPDFISSPPKLSQVHLLNNTWNCSNTNLQWMAILNSSSSVVAKSRIVDYANLTCQGILFRAKPLPMVMNMHYIAYNECPDKCACELTNLVQKPWTTTFTPVSTVDCRHIGLKSLPTKIPSITTNLLLQGNNISDLRPISQQNSIYKNVLNIFLDDNNITSVATLEGSDWMQSFNVLSLRGNNISHLPTHAFEHSFESNKNLYRVFLGNNPWLCNCQFTPSFQELLLKYVNKIGDLKDIRCRHSEVKEISNIKINMISRRVICRQSESLHTVDIVNISLASLICLIVSKFCYDYYYFKKTGKLPWISSKMPL